MNRMYAFASVLLTICLISMAMPAFAQQQVAQQASPTTEVKTPEWLVGTWKGLQTHGPYRVDNTTTFRSDGTWVLEAWSKQLGRGVEGEGTVTAVDGDQITLKGHHTKGSSASLSYTLTRVGTNRLEGTGIGAGNNFFDVSIMKE